MACESNACGVVAVHLQAQRLELLDNVAGVVVCDRVGRHAEVEPRDTVGRIVAARQVPDDIQKFLLGQSHQRAAEQRTEGERVAMVGEHAGYGDQVLDLLSLEQSLAGLAGDGDAAPLQSLLVAPEITPGGREQSDVAGPAPGAARRFSGRGRTRCRSGARTSPRWPRLRRPAVVGRWPCRSRPPPRCRARRPRALPHERAGRDQGA